MQKDIIRWNNFKLYANKYNIPHYSDQRLLIDLIFKDETT